MQVRRRPDGRPWRGPTDIANGLSELGVDVSVSMIAQLINGKQANPGARLRDGLAVLFRVPLEYFAQPLTEEIRARAAEVDGQLQAELRALQESSGGPSSAGHTEATAEDEQPSWTTVAGSLTQGVRRIANGIGEELHLTASQAEALLHLAGTRHGHATVHELGELCGVTPASASRFVDVLEARGLVRPFRQVSDTRRIRRIEITEHARETVTRHSQPRAAVQAFLDSMGPAEKATAQKVLAMLGQLAAGPGADETAPQDGQRGGDAEGVA